METKMWDKKKKKKENLRKITIHSLVIGDWFSFHLQSNLKQMIKNNE